MCLLGLIKGMVDLRVQSALLPKDHFLEPVRGFAIPPLWKLCHFATPLVLLWFQGKTVFLPGLLAKAHRGILYVDDINLLDTELCQILLGIVTDGWVNVEVSVEQIADHEPLACMCVVCLLIVWSNLLRVELLASRVRDMLSGPRNCAVVGRARCLSSKHNSDAQLQQR